MQGIGIIVIIGIAIAIYFLRTESHQKRIYQQIELMGGQVIIIEKRNFFTGIGPFTIVGKGRMVYRVEYIMGNQSKEGWVRFGGIMGADWRL